MCLCLCALFLFQNELYGRVQAQNDLQADDACFQATQQIQSSLTELKTAISDLALFVESEHGVNSEGEEKLVLGLAAQHPGLEGVGVVQVISQADRANFEKTSLRGRSILRYNNGRFDRSPEEPQYAVVRSIDMGRDPKAFGLDLFSEPKRASAIKDASLTDQIVLSAPLTSVLDTNKGTQSNLIVKSADENFKKGSKLFVIALFRPSMLAEKSNGIADHAQIIEVSDVSKKGGEISSWQKTTEDIPHVDRKETVRFGGRVFALNLEYLSPPDSGGIRWLKLVVWVLGGLVSLLATVLVATLSYKRIHAEEHQRQLQDMAAEMMDELYETVPQVLANKNQPTKKP